ncbi:PilZ domain-containing protein [Pseudomonas duriflava]|uniref:PilZ domain-containing protein n=1 Tax=Pseudomonas duriflava TaxID=459528 RepID=A0A562QLM7_9PSED|nr:PilZ domain-containing protein [Pseudomonas duriflava]TWI57662.1 PilZ domain-containing protein [Pseudomonas duriflava]
MGINQRRHPRVSMKCRLRITHPTLGELIVQTRDLSDGGVYAQHPTLTEWPIGIQVQGQVLDLPIEAPVVNMELMRVDALGAGFRFLRS